MKKALFVATIGSFLNFEKNDINILKSMGYEVHCATNMELSELDKITHIDVIKHQIDFSRSPFSAANLRAYQQLKKLMVDIPFDLVHCHTPVGGIIGRLVARKYQKKGTRVLYTAHGFHFFKGAPIKNWLLFFPIEWFFAHWTDVLITINKEDYELASKKMRAKRVEYIPGVGIDTDKFTPGILSDKEKVALRTKLGISTNAKFLLSVGELSPRKNHQVVIRALAKLSNPNIFYCIVGTGPSEEEYRELIRSNNLENNIFLLGYRSDVAELCVTADCFVHPSIREGLGIAPLEAMACGLPLISSYTNGIKDYTAQGVSGCCVDPTKVDQVAEAIQKVCNDTEFCIQCGKNNRKTVQAFDIRKTEGFMKQIYIEVMNSPST